MKKFLTCIIVVILLVSVVCCVACSKETSFEKVVDCAKEVQTIMMMDDDLESFEINGDCGYKLGYDDYPFTVFIYIPFKATYKNGEQWIDVAYFAGGDRVGFYTDFDDGTYDEWDIDTQLLYLSAGLVHLEDLATEKFSKDEVNKALSIDTEDEAVEEE